MRRDFDEISDEELWRRAGNRDGASYGELFERHADAVYNHCFRRTASWSTAQDLTSVVFLEAWRRKKEVKLYGDSILPWLLAVANNVIRNSERSLRRRRRLVAKLSLSFPDPSFEDDTDQRLDDERSMARILEQLGSLRIEEREVVALCDWAGLSSEQAAVALSVPVGTIKSRRSRARTHLRELVRDDAPIGIVTNRDDHNERPKENHEPR